MGKIKNRIIIILIFCFGGWLSLFPEYVQLRYYCFFLCLLAGMFICSFKRRFIENIQDIFFYLLLLSFTLSTIFAYDRKVAWLRYYYLVPHIFFMYYVGKNLLYHRKEFVSMVFSVFAILVAVIGILEFLWGKNLLYEKFWPNPYYPRYILTKKIMATQYHPSVLGTYFLGVLPFAVYLGFYSRHKFFKNMGKLSMVLASIGIWLTFSWGAIISVYVFLCIIIRRKWMKLIFILLLLLIFIDKIIYDRFSPHGPVRRWVFRDDKPAYNKLLYKLQKFEIAYREMKLNPLLGVGLDNFRVLYDKYCGMSWRNISWGLKVCDNMYLTIIVEMGILGAISFGGWLFLLLLPFKNRFTSKQNWKYNPDEGFLFLIYAGFLSLLFNMFTYEIFYWKMPLSIFWTYAGILREGHNVKSI